MCIFYLTLTFSEEFVIAGGIIIAVSIIVLIVGVLLCISLNKKSNSGTTLNNGVVMSVSTKS